MPRALNDSIRDNSKALIGCLFRAVSQTLLTFAKNPKHLGTEPGLIMVLHTWSRRLNYHVHLHQPTSRLAMAAEPGAVG